MKDKNDSIYPRMNTAVREHKSLPKLIRIINRVTTAAIYILFPFMLLYITDFGRSIGIELLNTISVCGAGFLLLTLLRRYINRKRPYTVYGYEPIIPRIKNTGSMPSRHVFSAFIIALASYQMGVMWFAAAMTVSVIIAVLRVVGGVHYITDVVVAFLIAALLGVPAFILI